MKRWMSAAAVIAGAAALATAAYAGGFWLEVELPNSRDPKMKDAALIFRADGCHGPGSQISGSAEGIVDGKRKSIPLKFKPLGGEIFAVSRRWPDVGRWVLAVTAASSPNTHEGKTFRAKTSVVVELSHSGKAIVADTSRSDRRQLVVVRRPNKEPLAELVEKTLKDYQARRASL